MNIMQTLYYRKECISGDKCNDENGAKRIMRSLFIENKLHQELFSLVEPVPSFNPIVDKCNNINNTTSPICWPEDIKNCNRCLIYDSQIESSTQLICATCPTSSISLGNSIRHYKNYNLNNRQVYYEEVNIRCQFKGCNSAENINRASSASKILFDLDEYHQNELKNIL